MTRRRCVPTMLVVAAALIFLMPATSEAVQYHLSVSGTFDTEHGGGYPLALGDWSIAMDFDFAELLDTETRLGPSLVLYDVQTATATTPNLDYVSPQDSRVYFAADVEGRPLAVQYIHFEKSLVDVDSVTGQIVGGVTYHFIVGQQTDSSWLAGEVKRSLEGGQCASCLSPKISGVVAAELLVAYPIPEPSAMLLLTLGTGAMLAARRKWIVCS